ncbi:hypothetical protein F9278_20080 [Streptomyces phaeolivaceus]|uniref:Uncharacterized protein n=1 Tax=Streptomyces phaeolivaceus TaxID=2653200 RepID=A0A5P8K548_9ACTN|nr:hypothetical protein [Streptomyces phaeolivaceus]QFQ98130.1 hypothetical protein F9278_20080 [Streptomyces phaeolivaceus]
MASSAWARRRTRRAVRRGLTRFEARLRSACPGIGFTARITATVLTPPPYPDTDAEIAAAVRGALREAAADVSQSCDPWDLPSARDAVGRHLSRRRRLPTDPPVEFRAEVALDLAPDDRAAVADLLAAQRGQAVADALRRQRTDAVAAELADPAALLLRWIERDGSDWSRLSAVVTDAEKVAEVFARHRPAHERTVDHEALEVLREFLGSFPDPSQKLMLYTLLAAGMDHAKRPQHAAKTLSLLNGHAQLGETGGG